MLVPIRPPQTLNAHSVALYFHSVGDSTITEFAAWSPSEISQNALVYYSGRLFWINGFRIITAQEIGQRTSVSVSEPAKFNQFTIIQASLKPLPGTSFYPYQFTFMLCMYTKHTYMYMNMYLSTHIHVHPYMKHIYI